jgi:hypothetical protein
MIRILALVFLATLHPVGSQALTEPTNSQAAGALFQQFETVFHVKANKLAESDDRDFLNRPFAFLLQGLATLEKNAPKKILDSSDSVLVGTKDYLPPNGLGIVRSKFCYVVNLQHENKLNLQAYFKGPVASVAGAAIWKWSAELNEFGENDHRATSLYMTEVRSTYLLISNDIEDVEGLSAVLQGPDEGGIKILATIREWRETSQHEFWGYRKYRHIRISNRNAAGMTKVTSGAEALIIYSDRPHKSGVLRLLTIPEDGTATNLNSDKQMPPLVLRAPGIWQSSVPLRFEDADQSALNSLFALGWLFGLGSVI